MHVANQWLPWLKISETQTDLVRSRFTTGTAFAVTRAILGSLKDLEDLGVTQNYSFNWGKWL